MGGSINRSKRLRDRMATDLRHEQQIQVISGEDDDEEEMTAEELNSASPSTSLSEDLAKGTSDSVVESKSFDNGRSSSNRTQTLPIQKIPKIESSNTMIEWKPAISPIHSFTAANDDPRKLFQRLWTDEDEIDLLQGFLEYTIGKGRSNVSHGAHHHENQPFYDQIKNKLRIDFNKNQLAEKLRRLKKKYRNNVNRIKSGKDFTFRSSHEQMTFEISTKIWNGSTSGNEPAGFDDEEAVNQRNRYGVSNISYCNKSVDLEKNSESKKRIRKQHINHDLPDMDKEKISSTMPKGVEETVRNCLSPLFKELINGTITGSFNLGPDIGEMPLNPLQLNIGGSIKFSSFENDAMDEKWRKQQILELEVYSKRIELMQEQIKSALEELKSVGE